MELTICHVYPDVLNLYGDRGNIICMKRRLEWRGVSVNVIRSGIGEKLALSNCDIVFIGGGQDFEQETLLPDLHTGKDKSIVSAIEDGVVFLTICGGYQLLGEYYETHDGNRCKFIGALDMRTIGSEKRMIGNYVFDCGDGIGKVIAFENHSGKTWLSKDLKPLGTVLSGCGNNGTDRTEGARYKNVFGSYGHGSLLPKNPLLCDYILKTALERKYGSAELAPLDDTIENRAHDEVIRQVMAK